MANENMDPNKLDQGKDPVGDNISPMSGAPSGGGTGGTEEPENQAALVSEIESKMNMVEATTGVRPNIVPTEYFKGERKAFNLIKELDKQLEKALSAKSPEEWATSMFWAALNCPFTTANAWLEHRKGEKERLDKEYKSNVADYERSIGVSTIDKFMAGWSEVMKNLPPEYGRYVDKDGRLDKKAMPKGMWNDLRKQVFKNPTIRAAVEQKAGHYFETNEWEKITKGMFAFVDEKAPPILPNKQEEKKPKKETGAEDFKNLFKNLKEAVAGLNQTVSELKNILKRGKDQHNNNQSHEKEGEQLRNDRQILNDRRNRNQGRGGQTQTRGPDRGR